MVGVGWLVIMDDCLGRGGPGGAMLGFLGGALLLLVAGLGLTAIVGLINYRGIRTSGRFQDITTLGLLACFAVFVVFGFARGSAANLEPLFASSGPLISVLLVLQIVPYFMTGFESIPKASEEARPGLDPRLLSRMIALAVVAGGLFYVLVVGVAAWVYPWSDLVAEHLGTGAAFARAIGAPSVVRRIFAAAQPPVLRAIY